jgi:RHS repeat-associated protein
LSLPGARSRPSRKFHTPTCRICTWWYYPAASASTTTYAADALNRYTTVGSVTPQYDGNGNLTFDGTFIYGYDAENRLINVTQGATQVASYAYDGQGRRKSKTVGSTITFFITDADNREVLEYDGTSGQVQRWYSYGLGPNDVLNQMDIAGGTRTTLIPDIQGSFIATLTSGGTLGKAGYLPYGASGSTTGTFRYTGQRIDSETNGLYYYRARMYKPAWGSSCSRIRPATAEERTYTSTSATIPSAMSIRKGLLIIQSNKHLLLPSNSPNLPQRVRSQQTLSRHRHR